MCLPRPWTRRLLGLALLVAVSGFVHAARPEIADKQADLEELRGRIDKVRKELASSETSRADAADRLRASESEISTLQRELHQLSGQQFDLQLSLKDLRRQADDLESRLGLQQRQLEHLLYRQYLQGAPDSIELMLKGGNPNQMARDLHYLSHVARVRKDLLREISQTLAQKKNLAEATQSRMEDLDRVELKRKEQHSRLLEQRNERQVVLSQISEKVAAQRKEITDLQQNEKRLTLLIDHLSKAIAAQARQHAAETSREKAAEPGPSASGRIVERPRGDGPNLGENRLLPEASSGSFARLKGNLRLPVRGNITGKFGNAREGSNNWKGIFIRSGSGSEVRAIAQGRVVFADWMRGFGNLLILDHGDGYLSIYGYNEAVLKKEGETVRGGEAVATVGNSGGNAESGLYFELRHQGQPVDPMKWVSLK
ncbi:MAG: hypothetical protein RIR00_335 [Pseudomonadota bacterium]